VKKSSLKKVEQWYFPQISYVTISDDWYPLFFFWTFYISKYLFIFSIWFMWWAKNVTIILVLFFVVKLRQTANKIKN